MRKLILFTALLLILAPTASFAEPTLLDDKFSSEQKDAFEEVQGNIMSPYCPGRLLKDCPSTAARELKVTIKERILSGESAEAIKEDLLEEFGEDMRASPKAEGIGMLAWIAPFLFLLLGAVVITFWVIRQSKDEEKT